MACALSEVEKEKLQSLDTDEALARALQEVEEENAFSGFTRYNKVNLTEIFLNIYTVCISNLGYTRT